VKDVCDVTKCFQKTFEYTGDKQT